MTRLKDEGWLKDALYNLDGRSGANLDYCKGLVVGVVAARVATGLTFQAALAEVARLMPHNETAVLAVPEGWRNDLRASLKQQGVEI
jgi:hypothetical protein